jgi:hypothetical protein
MRKVMIMLCVCVAFCTVHGARMFLVLPKKQAFLSVLVQACADCPKPEVVLVRKLLIPT